MSSSTSPPGSAETDDLDARVAAMMRRNEALDSEWPQMVSDVDALIERDRHVKNPTALPSNVLSQETAQRLRRAKAKAAEQNEYLEREREFTSRIQAAETEKAKADQENKALKKEVAHLRHQLDRAEAARSDAENQAGSLKGELRNAERAIQKATKDASQKNSETRSVDVRLARALQDAEKSKLALQEAQRHHRDAIDDHRKHHDKLQAHIRKLDHHKSQLLTAFKKQLKLIDVLKRQKIHMEAARLLAFTEDDFINLVDFPSSGSTAGKKKPFAGASPSSSVGTTPA